MTIEKVTLLNPFIYFDCITLTATFLVQIYKERMRAACPLRVTDLLGSID